MSLRRWARHQASFAALLALALMTAGTAASALGGPADVVDGDAASARSAQRISFCRHGQIQPPA
jgi:hypothetical protein